LIVYSLVLLVIPDYDGNRDKPVVCHHCDRRHNFSQELIASLDWRFNSDLCEKLDEIAKLDWERTLQQWQQIGIEGVEIDLSVIGKNLRTRIRTSSEEMLARRKHEDCIDR
jgi:hypothetical protein